jgi:O-methyltransferase
MDRIAAIAPSPEDLYLDLLLKALTASLWDPERLPQPPRPRLFEALRWMWHRKGRLSNERVYDPIEGRGFPRHAHTMIGTKRMANLRFAIETVEREGIPGDLIETGVWRGGACIFMRGVLAAHHITHRKVFVADSFEGLPAPDPAYPVDAGDRHHLNMTLAVSLKEVQDNFRRYGLLDEQVVFIKGWFRETLAVLPTQSLAVLRLDGDMYGSTMEALRHLYPRLSAGGFCIIDDYALRGCRRAVDDFRRSSNIETPLTSIDWTGVYWRKA